MQREISFAQSVKLANSRQQSLQLSTQSNQTLSLGEIVNVKPKSVREDSSGRLKIREFFIPVSPKIKSRTTRDSVYSVVKIRDDEFERTESKEKSNSRLEKLSKSVLTLVSNDKLVKKYKFDHIISGDQQNQELFNHCIVPMLKKAMERGESCTIMNFGERRSGKSSTFGIAAEKENTMIRSLRYWLQNSRTTNRVLTLSCFELFQRQIIDLLKNPVNSFKGPKLSTVRLNSLKEAEGILEEALYKRKQTRSAGSSISHLVLTLAIQPQPKNSDLGGNIGCFSFIDLAGFQTSLVQRKYPESLVKVRPTEGIDQVFQKEIDDSLIALEAMVDNFSKETRIHTGQDYLCQVVKHCFQRDSRFIILGNIFGSSSHISASQLTLDFVSKFKSSLNNKFNYIRPSQTLMENFTQEDSLTTRNSRYMIHKKSNYLNSAEQSREERFRQSKYSSLNFLQNMTTFTLQSKEDDPSSQQVMNYLKEFLNELNEQKLNSGIQSPPRVKSRNIFERRSPTRQTSISSVPIQESQISNLANNILHKMKSREIKMNASRGVFQGGQVEEVYNQVRDSINELLKQPNWRDKIPYDQNSDAFDALVSKLTSFIIQTKTFTREGNEPPAPKNQSQSLLQLLNQSHQYPERNQLHASSDYIEIEILSSESNARQDFEKHLSSVKIESADTSFNTIKNESSKMYYKSPTIDECHTLVHRKIHKPDMRTQFTEVEENPVKIFQLDQSAGQNNIQAVSIGGQKKQIPMSREKITARFKTLTTGGETEKIGKFRRYSISKEEEITRKETKIVEPESPKSNQKQEQEIDPKILLQSTYKPLQYLMAALLERFLKENTRRSFSCTSANCRTAKSERSAEPIKREQTKRKFFDIGEVKQLSQSKRRYSSGNYKQFTLGRQPSSEDLNSQSKNSLNLINLDSVSKKKESPHFFQLSSKTERLNATPSFKKKFGPNLSQIHEYTENNLQKTLSREQYMRERRPSIVSQAQRSTHKEENTLNLRDSYGTDKKADKSEEAKHSSISSSRLSKEEKLEFRTHYQSTPSNTFSFKKKLSAPGFKMTDLPKSSPLRPRTLQYHQEEHAKVPIQNRHGSWIRRSSRAQQQERKQNIASPGFQSKNYRAFSKRGIAGLYTRQKI